MDERHEHGYDSPADHDISYELASAPSLGYERTRKSQDKIAAEKYPRSKADHCWAKAEIVRHLQRSCADVHPVEKRDDVQDEQVGQKAPRRAVPGPLRDIRQWCCRGDKLGRALRLGHGS